MLLLHQPLRDLGITDSQVPKQEAAPSCSTASRSAGHPILAPEAALDPDFNGPGMLSFEDKKIQHIRTARAKCSSAPRLSFGSRGSTNAMQAMGLFFFGYIGEAGPKCF
jgi:hypothetical protein